MANKYDLERNEYGSNPTNVEVPSQFRGPRRNGLQVFGWFGNSMNIGPRQRTTVTRSFHGPRRDY